MLDVRDVWAGYDGTDVVRGLSFEVSAGQCLSVVGPNGCGKSTLLRAIAGLMPFRGEIYIGGKPASRRRQEAALMVGLMGQRQAAYFSYSVYDTVMMGRYAHIRGGRPRKQDHAAVQEALGTVDLLDSKAREISRLSGGQLQRVFLARLLAQQPHVILLDEPTNHLDIRYQLELIEHLHAWVSQGQRCVVGVLHDINLAMSLSPKMLVMQDGAALAHTHAAAARQALDTAYQMDIAAHMRSSLQKWM